MTPITIVTWFASLLAVAAAITAYFAARRGLAGHQLMLYTQLQERFELLAATVATQETAIMNLRARLTMQATRSKRQERADLQPSSENSPASDDEKARIRAELSAKLANGSIRPPGR